MKQRLSVGSFHGVYKTIFIFFVRCKCGEKFVTKIRFIYEESDMVLLRDCNCEVCGDQTEIVETIAPLVNNAKDISEIKIVTRMRELWEEFEHNWEKWDKERLALFVEEFGKAGERVL